MTLKFYKDFFSFIVAFASKYGFPIGQFAFNRYLKKILTNQRYWSKIKLIDQETVFPLLMKIFNQPDKK